MRERRAAGGRPDGIRRPALPGHLGDWIAALVFGIELNQHVAKGVDGRFADGRTVNIRWS